jgi:hypothetical protein
MTDSKPNDVYVEKYDADKASNEKSESFSLDPVVTQYSKEETARILWKIDWRLVPMLSVLYL